MKKNFNSITDRESGLSLVVENDNFSKYLYFVGLAKKKFIINGELALFIGKEKSDYAKLEDRLFNRYLK